jgi:hypothetical protein
LASCGVEALAKSGARLMLRASNQRVEVVQLPAAGMLIFKPGYKNTFTLGH